MNAYETGRDYAREYWACPCMACLRSWFGYQESSRYFFRQGFYDQARLDDPLEAAERIARCPICDITGACSGSEAGS